MILNRYTISLFTFFLSSLALAYPAVGDRVEWIGSVKNSDSETIQIKVTKEILGQDKKDRNWLVKKVIHFGDETTEETNEISQLYSPEHFQKTLASCESSGGQLDEITVPAGTYTTCKITTVSEDGRTDERWWGDVPFGLVRKNTTNTSNTAKKKLDLRSVMAGL